MLFGTITEPRPPSNRSRTGAFTHIGLHNFAKRSLCPLKCTPETGHFESWESRPVDTQIEETAGAAGLKYANRYDMSGVNLRRFIPFDPADAAPPGIMERIFSCPPSPSAAGNYSSVSPSAASRSSCPYCSSRALAPISPQLSASASHRSISSAGIRRCWHM